MTDFDNLVREVLKREGGYVNHPDDRGAATNMGITQRTYTMWLNEKGLGYKDVRDITKAQAVEIYKWRYWYPSRCDVLPREIRDIHFDSAVNHGVTRAGKLLQAACGAKRDGLVGPATLALVASMSIHLLRARYIIERYKFYGEIIRRDRTQVSFIAGWLHRMESFT